MSRGNRGRRALRWTAIAVFLLALFYGAYPYWALYRLDRALEAHDTQSLDALIDWPRLRRNVRDDIVAAASAKLLPNDAESRNRFGADLLAAWGAALVDAATRGFLTSDALATLY